MRKRLFSILLCLVMIVGLMPSVAWADGTVTYTLSVGGKTLSAATPYLASNGTSATATELTDNYAHFDATRGVLTLSNFTLDSGDIEVTTPSTTNTESTLTIELVGSNHLLDGKITTVDTSGKINLIITGNGSLNAENAGGMTTVYVKNGNITVQEGAKVTLKHNGSSGEAMHAVTGKIIITGSGTELNAVTIGGSAVRADATGGGVEVREGAKVYLSGTTSALYKGYSSETKLTVTGEGGTAYSSDNGETFTEIEGTLTTATYYGYKYLQINSAPALKYTVTWNAKGGQFSETETTKTDTLTYGTTITAPTGANAPTKEGCTLDGWYTDATAGTKLGDSEKITNNVTYYAHWSSDSRTNVDSQITFPDGELTYNGAGQKYEKATISDITAGSNPTWSYTYEVPIDETGVLKDGLPMAVGTYTVTAKYEDSANVGTKEAVLTIKAAQNSSSSKKSSGSSRTYLINTPTSTEHGTLNVSAKSASKDTIVTVTAKAEDGYRLDTLSVADADGNIVKLTNQGDGECIFAMPASDVNVKATFAKQEEVIQVVPVVPAEVSPFTDVPVDEYYYDAVKWAHEKNITGGTGDGLFSPDGLCTRAQIVTFLWRVAGSPEPAALSSFVDVPADEYYAKAVAWAVANGITVGTDESHFSPDATCTRAHAVTFLARGLKGTSEAASGFTDVAADSYYASAVAWAKAKGITNGVNETQFGPDNDCTRAQIVTFLYRAYEAK